MIDTPVGLIDSLLKPDSTEDSKHSGKRLGKLLKHRAIKSKTKITVKKDCDLTVAKIDASLLLIVIYDSLVS